MKTNNLYVAQNDEGELYQSGNGKYIWSSLGALKNSITSRSLQDLDKYTVYKAGIILYDKISTLEKLKDVTISVRKLREEISDKQSQIDKLLNKS